MNPDNFNQKIVIVVDEASLYFNSRDYKNFPPEMYPFLVQLRKLNVSLLLIVQKVNQLDIAFRRVAFEVIEYRKALYFIRVCQHFEIETDEANIHDDTSCSPGASRPLL